MMVLQRGNGSHGGQTQPSVWGKKGARLKKKKAFNSTHFYWLSPQKGNMNTVLTGKLTLVLLEHQRADFLFCESVRKYPKWPSVPSVVRDK